MTGKMLMLWISVSRPVVRGLVIIFRKKNQKLIAKKKKDGYIMRNSIVSRIENSSTKVEHENRIR